MNDLTETVEMCSNLKNLIMEAQLDVPAASSAKDALIGLLLSGLMFH